MTKNSFTRREDNTHLQRDLSLEDTHVELSNQETHVDIELSLIEGKNAQASSTYEPKSLKWLLNEIQKIEVNKKF